MSAPCTGNCEFGDGAYVDPLAYDGSKCGCKKCPNFRFCKEWAPPWYFNCHSNRCGSCNDSFRKNLEFVDEILECPICLTNQPVHIKHPAGCGHSVCSGCFEEMWRPKRPVDIDPHDYGFSSGCTCTECKSYPVGCEAELTKWRERAPDDYNEYKFADEVQDDDFDTKCEERADCSKCSICRASVQDAPNNSWHQ